MVVEASSQICALCPSLAIDKLEFSGSETVQDAAIATYIQEGKKQKFKTQDRKKCDGGGLF